VLDLISSESNDSMFSTEQSLHDNVAELWHTAQDGITTLQNIENYCPNEQRHIPQLACPYPEASAVSDKACSLYSNSTLLIYVTQVITRSSKTLMPQANSHEMCFTAFVWCFPSGACPLWAHRHRDTCPLWAHTQRHVSSVSTHTQTRVLCEHTQRHVSSVSTHTQRHVSSVIVDREIK
jgi:hypothetical protein